MTSLPIWYGCLMRLREKKAQKVREAIYDAMITLVEHGGYEAATLEQVAERAEVGISTLYRYYANKDAILLDPFERTSAASPTWCAPAPTVRVWWPRSARSCTLLPTSTRTPWPDNADYARSWISHQDPGRGSGRPSPAARVAGGGDRGAQWPGRPVERSRGASDDHDHHDDVRPRSRQLDETTPADYADRILATLHSAGAPLPVRG